MTKQERISMVVEFCGTPGCGKTTVATALKDRLTACGYTVVNIHEKEPMRSSLGRLKHYCHSLAYRTYRKSGEIRKALRDYAIKNNTDRAETWINCILENVFSTDRNEKRYDFVLMDEGVIQFLSSLAHTNPLTDDIETVMSHLNRLHYSRNMIVVQCGVDLQENLRRIASRNRQGDRFLTDSKEEALKRLSVKQYNIDKVCTCLESSKLFPLDMTVRDEAVDRLFDRICANGATDVMERRTE